MSSTPIISPDISHPDAPHIDAIATPALSPQPDQLKAGISIANAPCSWGALEFDLGENGPGYTQVLDEMAAAGYSGSELGDWGFMPTDPIALNTALAQRQLQLVGGFVPIALAKPKALVEGLREALRTARLLAAVNPSAFIVLADDNGSEMTRTHFAGRIQPEYSLKPEQWERFAANAETVAKAVLEEAGLRTVFHHHGAGYVETPQEVELLMSLTDPNLLGLCLDTGHYAFGGGNPLDALKKYNSRIWHVHFKDYDPSVGEQAVQYGWNYFDSVQNGVFCELGKGSIDFAAIVQAMHSMRYTGWIVVEQDVLPGMGLPYASAYRNREFLRNLGL